MEAMDAGSQPSVILPSISSRDAGKKKKEDMDYQRKHSAAAKVSPSFPCSSPQPPYRHHAPADSAPPASLAGLISQPESRRTSGDEKERKCPARQSLPSIHEALASKQPMPYPKQTFTAPPSASQYYQLPAPSATAHPDPARTHYSPDFSKGEPLGAYSQTERSSYMRSPSQVPPYSQAQQEPSPAYEQNSQSARSMQQQPFAYNTYPAPYARSLSLRPPPPSQPNPAYPPSTPACSAPAGYLPTWRSDGAEVGRAEERKRVGRHAGPALHGESVKHYLDNFDFEASLNEIAEGSGCLNDFLQIYGQRSSPVPGWTPTISKVDDLMKQGQRIVDSLARIREYKGTNGYEPEESHHLYREDPKGGGGFAGSDLKKRRGRAAPPGRCHSCNGAETPECRRGPDGARTLCNACGLHYAKLTRKMGANKATIGSSNLRPKSLGLGSPSA